MDPPRSAFVLPPVGNSAPNLKRCHRVHDVRSMTARCKSEKERNKVTVVRINAQSRLRINIIEDQPTETQRIWARRVRTEPNRRKLYVAWNADQVTCYMCLRPMTWGRKPNTGIAGPACQGAVPWDHRETNHSNTGLGLNPA